MEGRSPQAPGPREGGGQRERWERDRVLLRWGRSLLVDSCQALAPQELLRGLGRGGGRRSGSNEPDTLGSSPTAATSGSATFDFWEP